jgi:hypothetical protein
MMKTFELGRAVFAAALAGLGARDSHNPSEWTSMLIALGMCGGALLIASALANISQAASTVAENTRFESRATIAT